MSQVDSARYRLRWRWSFCAAHRYEGLANDLVTPRVASIGRDGDFRS
jgi:hypothetical protein